MPSWSARPTETTCWQGVLTDITDRKLAEDALTTRDRILGAAGYAAERFLRAPSWQECIDDVLARLGLAGSATRAAVFENLDRPFGVHAALRHAWLCDDAPPAIDQPSSEPHPYGDELRPLGSRRSARGRPSTVRWPNSPNRNERCSPTSASVPPS